jgi:hypothetical protein
MRINFMRGITRGFTRKTVNLHVELVSDESRRHTVYCFTQQSKDARKRGRRG